MSKNTDLEVNQKALMINWYYERLQAVGRAQRRLVWSGLILALTACLIFWDPVSANKIQIFGIQIEALSPILPSIIFVVLITFYGALSTIKEPIDEIKKLSPAIGEKIKGIYSIDKNLNFLDYIHYSFSTKWSLSLPVYPIYILLVFSSSLFLVYQQITGLRNKQTWGQVILLSQLSGTKNSSKTIFNNLNFQ